LAAAEELVAIFYDLVSTADQVDVVFLEEGFNDCFTEGVGDTTIVFTPGGLAFLGIRPQKVTKKTIFRNFGRSSDLLQLGNSNKFRR